MFIAFNKSVVRNPPVKLPMEHSTPFPFRTVLNLRLLIEYWEAKIQKAQVPAFARGVLDYIQQAPELREPIYDEAVIERHREFISFLMSDLIPQANGDHELAAAILPFRFEALYATAAFRRAIDIKNLEFKGKANLPGQNIGVGKTIKACLMILEKYYQFGSAYNKPILLTLRDDATGLDRVYRVEINHQFCEVVAKAEPRPIDKQVLRFLMEKIYDLDLWMQYIRPDDYEFHGFMVLRMVDVTEQEMLSSIKYDLLEKSAVIRPESFQSIQHKLRSLFGIPEIRLGIAYFDPNNNLILNNGANECWKSLIDSSPGVAPCQDYTGSIYERSWMEKRYITIENLNEYPFRSRVEDILLQNGVQNILLAPLIDGDETIGMLELATPSIGMLNAVSAHKVDNVLPMFTAAVKRVKEEMSTEVRALIQEECTNIHPSVQWRFFEAGVKLMNKRRAGEKASMEEIVFKDVFPLYGLADVRNSSIERNTAIQKDLQQNLKLAKELLQQINVLRPLPLLEEIIYKTDEQLFKISRGLASGDESNVLEFLKNEIHPVVQHFDTEDELLPLITAYRENLDPAFGVVYKRRKSFEESINLINKTIGEYLDEAEKEAQHMFPHYFEKYKTDGVEYTLYVGTSMVKDRRFDPFYLRNFHLWQLLTTCEIYRRMELLKPQLKIPLDITQLILVHDQPISIRFRADEKQFDVDGAYDIRYEIVKKRIDKAYIKDTGERLTQPGKIAIVYNQARVEDEYRRYFKYLAARGLVVGDIEELDLEELPGATGLRALRFSVSFDERAVRPQPDLLKDIKAVLQASE